MCMIRGYLILWMCLGILVLGSSSAFAQVALKNFEKKLGTFDLPLAAQFESATNAYKDTKTREKALAYQIRLPKSWRKVTSSSLFLQQNVLGEIARYVSAPRVEVPSYFSLKAEKLRYDMPAKYWFLQHALDNAYSLEGVTIHDINDIEAVYIQLEGDVEYAVRVRIKRNGDRMLKAEYAIPLSLWGEERLMQKQALDSFQLLHTIEKQAEETDTYLFLDISKFSYPLSWRLDAGSVRNAQRMDAALINEGVNGSLNGQVEVYAVSKLDITSLKDELITLRYNVTGSGLEIKDLVEQNKDFKVAEGVKKYVMEAYNAVDDTKAFKDYEFWFSIISFGDYYYFITLLTPSRDVNFAKWVRNTETYKIIVASVQSTT